MISGNKLKVYSFLLLLFFIFISSNTIQAQNRVELSAGWKCQNISKVEVDGVKLSNAEYPLEDWLPAVVPGTVLTTFLENEMIPDPFIGMNNEKIPDIFQTGKEHYTYWFVHDFEKTTKDKDEELWLHLRGVNYGCDVYLNEKKVNEKIHKGMFLRQTYNITDLVNTKKSNRLAVLIYPPDHVGNANGGQGGDGTIAKGVGHQYVAGWDWIQPIRDRNTGIWDKVWIEKTKTVNLKNPHIITRVPGKRAPAGDQKPAHVLATAELENTSNKSVSGTLQYHIENEVSKIDIELASHSTKVVSLPDLQLQNPRLWWPNGYGPQSLYDVKMQFLIDGEVSDEENLKIGVREIRQEWNPRTRSTEFLVNGQKVFIKGGNWIISDAMLRFSPERYDTEIRFHRDMNLNMIRIWGGAITERPEFYEACDKYGLLVMQDFWMSGDCNGRWLDPKKAEDQWTRRQYPDDHNLFLESASDMIKMIRNYPSLAVWCGGNEITPPEDILNEITDKLIPELDGTRKFITYSNSDSMSYNFIGGNGDGPYGIQPIERFWQERTFPFNSEVGSVGAGDYESLIRFIPEENMTPPEYKSFIDSVWQYHKYIGYDNYIDPYGVPDDARDFLEIAQLINYNQYRALSEGFTSHMWDWYTGYIIWKTQNPWTALRGQMYDYYLDPNACLYGLHHGNELVHVMCNPVNGMVMVANQTFDRQNDLMLRIEAFDNEGNSTLLTQVFVYMEPSSVKNISSIKRAIDKIGIDEGCFIRLQLLKNENNIISENFYWFPNTEGNFTGLQTYEQPAIKVKATKGENGKVMVNITNAEGGPVSFFNRVSLVDPDSKLRILPVFYSDNYVTIPPGEQKTITIEHDLDLKNPPAISIKAWNSVEQFYTIEE